MPTAEQIVEWLTRQGAIRVGESPWRTLGENEEAYLIDWDRLFPRRRPRARIADTPEPPPDSDFDDLVWAAEEASDPRNEAGDFAIRVGEALEAHRPTDNEGRDLAESGGWDTCAWYQPLHFFGHDWGIFVRRDCILDNSVWIARFLPRGTTKNAPLLNALVRAGFAAFFLHEQFHHKIESLGIRLHVIEQRTRYLPYVDSVYRPTYGSDDNLEEALANADAFSRIATHPYSTWTGPRVTAALQDYLRWRFPFDPPGYRRAIDYLNNKRLNHGIDLLHGQTQEARLKPSRSPDDWDIATRLHQSQFKVTDHLWEVVPAGACRPILPGAVLYKSISTTAMVRLCEQHGYRIVQGRGKGSHVWMEKPGAPSVNIPGNRRDLSPGVVKTTLNTIGNYKLCDLPRLMAE